MSSDSKELAFSTSYTSSELGDFITSFVRLINPKKVVEIGCQQGMSSILIGRGLGSSSQIHTYDLFSEVYSNPPYKETHADQMIAWRNIQKANLDCRVDVYKGTGFDAFKKHSEIDLLHIDICNHYDNLKPLLEIGLSKVKKAIILEGGIFNQWQKKHGFTPYYKIFEEELFSNWTYITIPENDHNAITILTRKIT